LGEAKTKLDAVTVQRDTVVAALEDEANIGKPEFSTVERRAALAVQARDDTVGNAAIAAFAIVDKPENTPSLGLLEAKIAESAEALTTPLAPAQTIAAGSNTGVSGQQTPSTTPTPGASITHDEESEKKHQASSTPKPRPPQAGTT